MRLLRHLIAADIRHHRALLALWLAVVIATALESAAHPLLAGDPARSWLASLVATLLWWAWLLLFVTLVPAIVQTDPAVGSTAFWMTRPVPPMTLLTSKASLLVVVVVVLPAVGDVPQMAAYGVPLPRIAAVTLQTAFWLLFWAALLVAVSAVTASPARFVVVCASVIGAVVISLAVELAVASSRGPSPLTTTRELGPPDWSGVVVTIALLVLSAVALAVVQYRARSRLRSVAVGAAAVCVSLVAGSWWSWPFLAVAPPLPTSDRGSAVRLAADPTTLGWTEWSWSDARTPWRLIQAQVRLQDLAPGWSALVGSRDARLDVAGGPAIRSAGPTNPSPALVEGDESPTRGVVRRLLGVASIVEPPEADAYPVVLLATHAGNLETVARRSASYNGRMRVEFTRRTIQAVLPISAGAARQDRQWRFAIDRVERAGGRLTLLVRQSDALSMFSPEPAASYEYYFRNRSRAEAVPAAMQPPVGIWTRLMFFSTSAAASSSGFSVQAAYLRFSPDISTTPAVRLPESWVQGAELVIVKATAGGAVERPLEIPEFTIPSLSQ